jgi:NADPH-dependent 2,4-dienoyl-CoA reductase/sulfur reductase-like enzyme
MSNSKHIVIIGNGISGISCARNIRKLSDHRITVISAESDYFFSRTALMYIYMGHMRVEHTQPYENWFWKKNKIDLVRGYVERIDSDHKSIYFSDGKTIAYDILVIATGSKSNKFGWPGQDLKNVQGLYNLQDLELLEKTTKGVYHAVIVGGGLIGVEMAEMLKSRNISVTFLVREKSFWDIVLPVEEAKLISKHILEHGVDLRLETELKEIIGDKDGKASAVVTSKGETIPCQLVGLTVGVSPNIAFVKSSKIETDRGVLVNESFETNVPDVYAVGDCVQFRKPLPGRRPVEQVWYTGRMHGETLAKTICGQRTAYNPGLWFNSAKFFDIEYQTYGTVSNVPREGEKAFYWEHSDGKKCLRIVYSERDQIVIGFNVFGIRMRHEVCDRWLREKRTIDYVLENLKEANFDPEFFTRNETHIIQHSHKLAASI